MMLLLQDRRIARPAASTGPGSAAYGLPSHLQSRNDFNKATTTAPFHLPIAKKLERLDFPAPNQYDVCISTVHIIKNSFCVTRSDLVNLSVCWLIANCRKWALCACSKDSYLTCGCLYNLMCLVHCHKIRGDW